MPLSKRNLFPQAVRALSLPSFSFDWAPGLQYHSSPEYEQRARKHFTPSTIPLAALHCAIPKRLQKRSTRRSLYYVARHLAFTWAFYILACHIDAWSSKLSARLAGPSPPPSSGSGLKAGAEGQAGLAPGLDAVDEMGRTLVKTTVAGLGWCAYWWWQGIAFAGIWCLAHEVRSVPSSCHNLSLVISFIPSSSIVGRVPSLVWLGELCFADLFDCG